MAFGCINPGASYTLLKWNSSDGVPPISSFCIMAILLPSLSTFQNLHNHHHKPTKIRKESNCYISSSGYGRCAVTQGRHCTQLPTKPVGEKDIIGLWGPPNFKFGSTNIVILVSKIPFSIIINLMSFKSLLLLQSITELYDGAHHHILAVKRHGREWMYASQWNGMWVYDVC